jgi:hypothetical protein
VVTVIVWADVVVAAGRVVVGAVVDAGGVPPLTRRPPMMLPF